MSVGVHDNAGGPPQSASAVSLKFGEGTPSADVVVAQRVSTPMTVDGDAADWAGVPSSPLALVGPATAIGMTQAQWDAEYTGFIGRTVPFDFGITTVTARAAWDDQFIYFLLEWADPTANASRDTWFADGGVFVRPPSNEDRAHLAFNVSFPAFDAAGCAAACHVKQRLGDFSRDGGVQFRFFMHTDAPGELTDVWSWRATSTPVGDDQHWDEVMRRGDGPVPPSVLNRTFDPDAGLDQPSYVSEDGVDASPAALYLSDAGRPAAVSYDGGPATAGATVPGWVFQPASPARAEVVTAARWASGRWVVEWRRARETADPKDAQFPDVP